MASAAATAPARPAPEFQSERKPAQRAGHAQGESDDVKPLVLRAAGSCKATNSQVPIPLPQTAEKRMPTVDACSNAPRPDNRSPRATTTATSRALRLESSRARPRKAGHAR